MKITNRIFYINVDGIPNYEIANYVTEAKKSLVYADDGSYANPIIGGLIKLNLWEDFFIPTRNSPSKVEILQVEVSNDRKLPKEE